MKKLERKPSRLGIKSSRLCKDIVFGLLSGIDFNHFGLKGAVCVNFEEIR